jgi:NAD(P)-dependent dehydrogenase (short-subunit alcohol dehydrogenase family)
MSGKAVLVTGAGKGIGRATVEYLDARGFRVFAGVRAAKDGEALCREISERITPVILDVTDAAQIAAAAETIGAQVGEDGLYGLVNNAGMAAAAPLELIPMDAFRHQIEVNLTGQLAVTQAMLPLIRLATGRIINITSVGGRIAGPMLGPYHASKFALEAITDCLRQELRPWGIEVIAVEPGAIATPIWGTSVGVADRMVTPRMTELYGDAMARSRQFAQGAEERGLPPIKVAEAIGDALERAKPRTRYIVGTDATIAIRVISRLPDRLRDRLMSSRGR